MLNQLVQTVDGQIGPIRAVSVGGSIYVGTRWYDRADVKCLACAEDARCIACEKDLSTECRTYTA